MPRPSARRIAAAVEAAEAMAAKRAPVICPLCERPIPSDARSSLHHLVPRLKGGTHLGTVRLHQICHSAIHARFSEAELARRLADVETLRADPELADFIAWVRTKPPQFHAPTRMSRSLRGSRKDRD
jgi:5-methylcytosine-specific restriction enzyme A